MSLGIKFLDIKIVDDCIIDGHHRYVASLLAENNLGIVPGVKTSATIVYEWIDVIFDDNDWDTEAKIVMLNEEDAKYNAIELEKLIELLK